MSICVSVKNATKIYNNIVILNKINADFSQGKIHGIVGRNGSGKSMLFKTICGFVPLTEGTISVFSKTVKPHISQNIGIILEEPGFLGNYSAYNNLRFLGQITGNAQPERIRSLLQIVGLDSDSKKHVNKFSLGMKHRLAIAQALIDNAPLLILDEPMNGLDKQGVKEMCELFGRLRDQNVTILMSSHHSEDIKSICDNVWEMEAGKLSAIY